MAGLHSGPKERMRNKKDKMTRPGGWSLAKTPRWTEGGGLVPPPRPSEEEERRKSMTPSASLAHPGVWFHTFALSEVEREKES